MLTFPEIEINRIVQVLEERSYFPLNTVEFELPSRDQVSMK